MFNLKTKLEQLIQPVASCDCQADFSVWISEILASPQEMMIIVDEEQIPQGLITKVDMLSLIAKSWAVDPDKTNHCRDVKSLNNFIQPLTCLSQTTTVGQFLVHFSTQVDNKNYVIVDRQGKLLGLVNISELLKICSHASQLSDRQSEKLVPELLTNLSTENSWQFSSRLDKDNLRNQPIINSKTNNLPINYDGVINEQEISFLLFSLFSQIALPLQITNNNSEVCYINSAWQEAFGSGATVANSSKQNSSKICSTTDNQNFTLLSQNNPSSNQLEKHHCSQSNNFLLSPFKNSTNHIDRTQWVDRSSFNLDQSRSESNSSYNRQQPNHKSNLTKWHYHQLPFAINNNSLSLGNQPQYLLTLATQANSCKEKQHNHFSQIQTKLQQLQHQFFLNISHDLKSPLTSIIGLSNLLNNEKLGKLNDGQMRYSQMIYHSGKKLITLINDFLSINQLANQKLSIDTKELALEDLISTVHQQISQKLRAIAETSNNPINGESHLELSVTKAAQTIIADRVCLQQILTRLLENSFPSCSQDQSIKITAEFWSKKWLAISIWGQGNIAPSTQQAFFCQELQSDRHNFLTSEENKQVLSLSLAQQLAKFHGGDISLITQQNHSNQFTVLLPQISSVSQATSPHPDLTQENNNLVAVFDSDMSRILHWQKNLAALGYHLLVARSTEDLIHKASCFQPHSIILDSSYVTPETSDLVEKLSSNPATKNTSLVYVDRGSDRLPSLDQNCLDQIKQKCQQIVTVPITSKGLKQLFPTLKQEIAPPRKSLTVMRLSVAADQCLDNCVLDSVFKNPSFCLCHHIIEADSLEQAYLLARIWKIDAIIWDGQMLEQPENHLKSLAKNDLLAAIPIITLDTKNTAIANQITNLNVFPCLLPAHERSIQRLTQVIQIAAGLN